MLWLDHRPTAVVEAKKLALGPQEVLTQAERYARGLRNSAYNFDGLKAPFLYSTNGEVIWFRDVRHPLNRSWRVADFHTPEARSEFVARDFAIGDTASPSISTCSRSERHAADGEHAGSRARVHPAERPRDRHPATLRSRRDGS